MYVKPMQRFLERKTEASNRFNSEVCMYVKPMQRFLERKTVASNRFNSEVCMYVCKSHAAIPGKENSS